MSYYKKAKKIQVINQSVSDKIENGIYIVSGILGAIGLICEIILILNLTIIK